MATGHIRTILTDEDPMLRQPSTPVELDDPELPQDIADLAATLEDFRAQAGFGRAISAPQIGVQKRLIIMNLGDGPVALINPEITARSERRQQVWDDCLSVPDTLVLVERSVQISLRYRTQNDAVVEWNELPADLSELMEHECDHLDGVLMTDRVVPGAVTRRRSAPSDAH